MSTRDVNIPLSTDNEGNAFSASKKSSKRLPCSAFLVQLTAQEQALGSFVTLSHVKRCSNTWADQLTQLDFTGFSEDLQLDELLKLRALDEAS